MPLRPFGLPTFSVKSRFLVEMMIMEAAKMASGVDPTVLERVRDVFITRLYGPGTAEGRPRPLIRLSIVEIETLQMIALDVCSDHPNDPDAAQEDVAEKLQRKKSGRTIFGLVDGAPIETLGRDIVMHGRTVLTDPEACVRAAMSITLHDEQGLVVDHDDHDDLIDGDLGIIMIVDDPAN